MQPHNLNPDQIAFFRKLYLLFGQNEIPTLPEVSIDLCEEWADIQKETKDDRGNINDVLGRKYMVYRTFTDKFVEDIICNQEKK